MAAPRGPVAPLTEERREDAAELLTWARSLEDHHMTFEAWQERQALSEPPRLAKAA